MAEVGANAGAQAQGGAFEPRAPVRLTSWSNILPAETRLASGAAGWQRALAGRAAVIPRGAGRSHGDCAYVGGGVTCNSSALDDVLAIDQGCGTVQVGAGLAVGELHRLLEGGTLEFPVLGGTQWATVGGAIAGDIHGKNHPLVGSFGNHVEEITLLTADGERLSCGPERERELFSATVGGLGLTGFIESATLKLRPAGSRTVSQSRTMLRGTDGMFALFDAADGHQEFSQAVWFDLSRRHSPGLFCSARRATSPSRPAAPAIGVPLPRVHLLRPTCARVASSVVLRKCTRSRKRFVHMLAYNYSGSHERLFHWNRLFGTRGVIEFQFALPADAFADALDELVVQGRKRSLPLLAAVVKRLGAIAPVGMLSFPCAGYTLSVQSAYSVAAVRFFRDFTTEIAAAGGRVNLTKDACTAPEHLAEMYRASAAWQTVARRYDPANRIASNMSRRLVMKPW